MKQRRQLRRKLCRGTAKKHPALFEVLEHRRVLAAVAFVQKTIAAPELDSSQEVWTADVDGDGDLDAVALSGPRLATFINAGEATFGDPLLGAEMASDIRSMLVADFDGDGAVEVISGGFGTGDDVSVGLHENDGAGNFTLSSNLLLGDAAGFVDDMEMGDFNGDGMLDAIAVDRNNDEESNGQVILLTNAGNGNFTSEVLSNTFTEPRAAHAVDLDNDSDLDLVVAATNVTIVIEGEQEEEVTTHFLFVLTNDGGAFTQSEDLITTGAEPRFMSSADFDNNGFMDIVVPQQGNGDDYQPLPGGGEDLPGAITVFYNNNGVISNADQLVVDDDVAAPERTGVLDIDQDGNMDIVITVDELLVSQFSLTSDAERGHMLAWYPSLGDGTFAEVTLINYVREASGLAFGDIDADGNVDIMTTSQFASQVQLHLNDGDTTFSYEELSDLPAFEPELAVPADIDGDGILDVVGMSDKYEISWYKNDGAGNFGPANVVQEISAGVSPPQFLWYDLQVADIDSDGDNDIIATEPLFDDVFLYENDGTGNFPEENWQILSMPDVGALEVRILDFDGDADMDFVTAQIFAGTVSVYERGADGTYTENPIVQAPLGLADFEVGDVDGDNDMDLLLGIDGAQSNAVILYENFGPDGFDLVDFVLADQGLVADVGLADMDGDGDLDAVTATYNFNGAGTGIQWFENTGQAEDQRFAEEGNTVGSQVFVKDLLTVDVDGDGDMDVLSADRANYGFSDISREFVGRVEWYENLGGGVFKDTANFFDEAEFDLGAFLGFGDLNGDGNGDITVPVGFDHELHYYEIYPLDLDADTDVDIDDVQTLCSDIRSGTNMHDLNGDGVANNDDMIVMLDAGFNSVVGDSNLSGAFGTDDLVAVFVAGEYEDAIPLNSTWATGDWNCDGEFGTDDLVYVFTLDTYDPNAGAVAAKIGSETIDSETIDSVRRDNQVQKIDGPLGADHHVQVQAVRQSHDLQAQTIDRIFSEV